MYELELKFFSIVFIGNFNPAILNHDFFVNNSILPTQDEDFKALLGREKAIDSYLCVPGLTEIIYGPYSFTVEMARFQAKDENNKNNFESSPIIDITRKYFSLLPHTPIKVGGLNLHYSVKFNSQLSKEAFWDCIFVSAENLCQYVGENVIRKSASFEMKFLDGKLKFDFAFTSKDVLLCNINVNYEFDYASFTTMGDFLAQLDAANPIEKRFLFIMERLRNHAMPKMG